MLQFLHSLACDSLLFSVGVPVLRHTKQETNGVVLDNVYLIRLYYEQEGESTSPYNGHSPISKPTLGRPRTNLLTNRAKRFGDEFSFVSARVLSENSFGLGC